MAVNTYEECQHSYSLSVSPEEGSTQPLFESPLTFIGYLEKENQFERQMCLDDQMKSENSVTIPMEKIDTYHHSVIDMVIGNREPRMLMKNGEDMEKLEIEEMFKNESPLKRVLQRHVSLPVGEKLVRLLMKDRFVLPKFNCTDQGSTSGTHHSIQEISSFCSRFCRV